ncbi:MAG: hypothetical protein RR234_10365 [Christensenella sp.]
MSTLSFLEVPALKKLVSEYGYTVHLHDACGGQSFTLVAVSDDTSALVYSAIEQFFAAHQMSVRFYDAEKLNFVAQ